jgi:hypothetical protein
MTDILLDTETGSLAIQNGDFRIGESDRQNQKLLLITDKGAWKEFPTAGVGAANYLEAENPAEFIKEVRQQFAADGMKVSRIVVENGKLKIDASY